MDDEPELYIFRPPDPVEEWRLERERVRRESRRVQLERLVSVLAVADACGDDPQARAEAVVDGFFVVRGVENDEPCGCSCHPRLPDSDLHDYGAACNCQRTAAERRASWEKWQAETDAYWASPEGLEITARRAAQEAELDAWLSADSGVQITSHGGMFPEQWEGSVDGHSFYFREKRDEWRIELDLRPNGHVVEVWQPDADEDAPPKYRELETGDVIAEGVTSVAGYGESPAQRARFIVDTIRTHLRRQACTVHTLGRGEYERLLGRPMEWCFECGARSGEPHQS